MAYTNSTYLTVWNLDERNGILNYNQSIYKGFFYPSRLSRGRSTVYFLPWSSFRIYLHSSTCGPSLNFKWLWPTSLSSFTDSVFYLPDSISMNSFMFQNPPFNHYVQSLFLCNVLYLKIPWIEIYLLGLCFNPTHYKLFLILSYFMKF